MPRFGNLGRNVIIGPGFSNVDFSVLKNIELKEDLRLQFRAEVFDLLNHANFGQPGRVVGSATFGQISNTRFSYRRFGLIASVAACYKIYVLNNLECGGLTPLFGWQIFKTGKSESGVKRRLQSQLQLLYVGCEVRSQFG